MADPSDRNGKPEPRANKPGKAAGRKDPEPEPRDRERHEGESAAEREARETREAREAREHDRSFRRLGDSLISSIWGDSSAAFKRGQGLVTGVAQGTKEELVRMISAEVRGFLDKMDAADLMQEIVSGLVIEMKTEIRFRRSEDGRIEPDISSGEAKLRHEGDEDDEDGDEEREDEGGDAPKPRPKPKSGKVKATRSNIKPGKGKAESE